MIEEKPYEYDQVLALHSMPYGGKMVVEVMDEDKVGSDDVLGAANLSLDSLTNGEVCFRSSSIYSSS